VKKLNYVSAGIIPSHIYILEDQKILYINWKEKARRLVVMSAIASMAGFPTKHIFPGKSRPNLQRARMGQLQEAGK